MMEEPHCTNCNKPLSMCGSWTTNDDGSLVQTEPTRICLRIQLKNSQTRCAELEKTGKEKEQ